MKEQHRIETPAERSERGRGLGVEMGHSITVTKQVKGKFVEVTYDSPDWQHHDEARAKLSSSERATFDLEFLKANARGNAGVRPAVDLALAEMRKKLSNRLGIPTWRAR